MIPRRANRHLSDRDTPRLVDGVENGIGDMLWREARIIDVLWVEPIGGEATRLHLANHVEKGGHILAQYADARGLIDDRSTKSRCGHARWLDRRDLDLAPAFDPQAFREKIHRGF